MNKKEIFIKKAKNKFGDDFDYSLVDYDCSTNKIKIKCNRHNIIFEQTPAEHLRGRKGCIQCKNLLNSYDTFLKRANEIHGDKYDYSLVNFINSTTKVKIICPIHGVFEQTPINHIKKQGCKKCFFKKNNVVDTVEEFINKSNIKHGNKYDYSSVEYINSKTPVKIICREHGEFIQLPYSHVRGKGCQKCAIQLTKSKLMKNKESFILDAIKKHGTKYDYSLVDYLNSTTKIKIICPKHGIFEQLPYDHIAGHGCNKCTSSVSSDENQINDFILSLGFDTICSSMSIIKPYQLDIFIPSKNIAIEYDGLYWHSEKFMDKNYHLDKTIACEKEGIKLIHIFEDEWLNKQDIVKSRLKNILGLTHNKIYARKCVIKNVDAKQSKFFLEKNHLQSNVNSKIRLGLYYNDELVSLMTFGKPRLGIGKKYDGYELTRFSNKLDTIVIGAADKLLKYFIKNYNPKEIISYADRRWSNGNLYEKLGFIKTHVNKPSYSYIIGKNRFHRFNFRKQKLKETNNSNMTEHEIMLKRNIYRIYDCGTITYKKIV
jgi:hypothetical protein